MASGKENPFNGWKLGKDDDLAGIDDPRPAEKRALGFANLINYKIFPTIRRRVGDYANLCVCANANVYSERDYCYATDVALTEARVHKIPLTFTYLGYGEDLTQRLVALCVNASELYGCLKNFEGPKHSDYDTKLTTYIHFFLFDDSPLKDSIIARWLQQRKVAKMLSQFFQP